MDCDMCRLLYDIVVINNWSFQGQRDKISFSMNIQILNLPKMVSSNDSSFNQKSIWHNNILIPLYSNFYPKITQMQHFQVYLSDHLF